ncbi:hypothetical protein MalM25_00270 [Planctomycetes bacterium MalM25]|nr:hypothetical protein MalM25_00270 [Planctomycetes bacterium MalM25]
MNELSRRLRQPIESDDQQFLRDELCNSRLLGNDGTTRYYVSVLTGTDQLGIRDSSFIETARELATTIIGEAATRYRYCDESVIWMWPLFESEYRSRYASFGLNRTWTTCDEASRLRLMHPEMDDETIAKLVPTTVKQLHSCSDYKYIARFLI